MPEIDKIYVDTPPLIDMGKSRASLRMDPVEEKHAEREQDVWYMKRLLRASRDGVIRVMTSSVTIVECLHLGDPQQPVPSASVQRFYSELLTSGQSGMALVQPIQSIFEVARNLRWKRGIFLKPMDSIHVATAIHMRCKEILTRDAGIYKFRDQLAQLNISVVYPKETALLPTPYTQHDLEDMLGAELPLSQSDEETN